MSSRLLSAASRAPTTTSRPSSSTWRCSPRRSGSVARDLFAILWAPFLMCLVLTGIHAYLGVHVLSREVVFVDIALAQIAALGATAAFLLGWDLDSWGSYGFALSFTIVGASVFALTRSRERRGSQEGAHGGA